MHPPPLTRDLGSAPPSPPPVLRRDVAVVQPAPSPTLAAALADLPLDGGSWGKPPLRLHPPALHAPLHSVPDSPPLPPSSEPARSSVALLVPPGLVTAPSAAPFSPNMPPAAQPHERSAPSFPSLPREIKLLVLCALLDAWQRPAACDRRRGQAAEDVSGRWVGEPGGRRELVKLSRVCKEWQALVYDGALWPALDTACFPYPPPGESNSLSAPPFGSSSAHTRSWSAPSLLLDNLARRPTPPELTPPSPSSPLSPAPAAGASAAPALEVLRRAAHDARAFVRRLALEDVDLAPEALAELGETLAGGRRAVDAAGGDGRARDVEEEGATGLEVLDIRAARGLTSGDILHLTLCSPNLTTLTLPHSPLLPSDLHLLLGALTHLASLDLSHSPHLALSDIAPLSPGLGRLDVSWLPGEAHGLVQELRGVRGLKALDLRGTDITDEDVRALVAPLPSSPLAAPTPAQAAPSDHSPLTRPLDQLQHLALSGTPLLTGAAAGYLTGCLPAIRFLEWGGYAREEPGGGGEGGAEVEGPGAGTLRESRLGRLLTSVRATLERLDLEDGEGVDDGVLSSLVRALHPASAADAALGSAGGMQAAVSRLEALCISGCRRVGAAGVQRVVEGCPALRVLEADGLRLADAVVGPFLARFDRPPLPPVSATAAGGTGAVPPRPMPARLSALDCPTLARKPTLALLSSSAGAGARTREGSSGWAWAPFGYHGRATEEGGGDETDRSRPVLASFWSWTALDQQQRRLAARPRTTSTRSAAAESEAAPAEALAAAPRGGRGPSGCAVM